MYSAKDFGIKVIKKIGEEEICICPFHSDHKPSASFNQVTGLFYCFVCQTGYDVAQLKYKLNVDIDIEPKIIDFWEKESNEKDYKERMFGIPCYHEYVKGRNISEEISKRHNLEFSESMQAIVIPNYDLYGNRMGAQLRSIKPFGWRYLYIGKRNVVWPMYYLLKMDDTKIALIVEGVFSAMRFETVYKGNRIIPFAFMGAKADKGLLQCFNGFNVTIRYDNDKAGITASYKAMGLYPLYDITYGPSIDDMNDEEIYNLVKEIEK